MIRLRDLESFVDATMAYIISDRKTFWELVNDDGTERHIMILTVSSAGSSSTKLLLLKRSTSLSINTRPCQHTKYLEASMGVMMLVKSNI